MNESFPAYRTSHSTGPLPEVGSLSSMTVHERRRVAGRDDIDESLAEALLLDPDEEIRAAILSTAWVTPEWLRRLVKRYPAEIQNAMQHEEAPSEFLELLSVGYTGTHTRQRLTELLGADADLAREFLVACSSVDSSDTSTTLGDVWRQLTAV
ncbi:hypothetical protein [Agromyces lapidis]|uniref:HEAT repeat domain-containing protein n=1 Tax=Agromyces lapidis TaxID=279574 RepID=A0ABV5SP01_9MICO|nr:hypothetical protein [Agromyces lapidis]